MKQDILTQFPFHALSVLGLLIFFIFFVGVCVLTGFKTQKKKHYESSFLPLNDEVTSNE